MKGFYILLALFIPLSLFPACLRNDDYARGPLYGKNIYIPHLIYLQLPAVQADIGRRHEFAYSISLYYTQDFITNFSDWDGSPDYDRDVDVDFESLVVETAASFRITERLQVGMALRLISYYGGFLDSVVESFHGAFNFPNAARDYFETDKTYVDIDTVNNVNFRLDGPSVGFGDIDLWVKYTCLYRRWISLAVIGGFKLPTGSFARLTGSGAPDMGAGVALKIKPLWLLSIHLQSSLIVPFDGIIPAVPASPYPMYNAHIAIELHPVHFFSFIAQLNIKTSPVSGNNSYINNLYIQGEYYSSPQTNLLIGFTFAYRLFSWQFYFEEDTFTNAGADFTINLMFKQKIKFP